MKSLSALILSIAFTPILHAAEHDIVIYGGTASGVATAIQATRMGKTAIIIEPGNHIGGLTSGGLGWTDSGNKAVIGGIAREFYQRLHKHYEADNTWTFGKREDYKPFRKDEDALWAFEPKVAEAMLRTMLKEAKVEVVFNERLERKNGVTSLNGRITSIAMESGKAFAGKMFVDASYEGDLMAAAKVTFTVGREANSQYGETLNGIAVKWQTHAHRFTHKVSPYVKAGDPTSGLLPCVLPKLEADGTADNRVQAYCYRMCMSLDPANRVPFAKPEGYDEQQYELLLRNFEAGDLRFPMKPDMMPNGKTDTNNNHAVSTDYIGMNYDYPNASYAEREAILKKHEVYQKGFMWTLQSHPRTPEKIRKEMAKWGLPKDEFTDNGGWPHQIYVREARRMVGEYVHSELDCRKKKETPVSVGMGSYNMDSHNVTRYVTAEGFVQNEGDVQESPGGPYRISYFSLVPKRNECGNLLVPVCMSSTHAAYGSIRMEPVFMILGQSAATAAVIAIDDGKAVQDIDIKKLQDRLTADKQVLAHAGGGGGAGKSSGIDIKKLAGIVVDDEDAVRVGFESASHANGGFVGIGYHHDGDDNKGKQTATYTPDLPEAGLYEVRLFYSPNENRARNVPVKITHSSGSADVKVNQKKKPTDNCVSLGKFAFEKGKAGSVVISNAGTEGHVVIDAVQWIKK
ncbi:FAD-dependent oxidoreductase [soil metagenome]